MMHNPPHPGETLKELYISPSNISITVAAKALNMTRTSLSEIVNGKRGISPKTSIKLAKAFGGSAESWLQMQAKYDLWHEQQLYKADDVLAISV